MAAEGLAMQEPKHQWQWYWSCSHGIFWFQRQKSQQTMRKLSGYYRTKEGFRPDFADFKHDYTQEFYWSYSFLSADVRGPVSFAVSTQNMINQHEISMISLTYCIQKTNVLLYFTRFLHTDMAQKPKTLPLWIIHPKDHGQWSNPEE